MYGGTKKLLPNYLLVIAVKQPLEHLYRELLMNYDAWIIGVIIGEATQLIILCYHPAYCIYNEFVCNNAQVSKA